MLNVHTNDIITELFWTINYQDTDKYSKSNFNLISCNFQTMPSLNIGSSLPLFHLFTRRGWQLATLPAMKKTDGSSIPEVKEPKTQPKLNV